MNEANELRQVREELQELRGALGQLQHTLAILVDGLTYAPGPVGPLRTRRHSWCRFWLAFILAGLVVGVAATPPERPRDTQGTTATRRK